MRHLAHEGGVTVGLDRLDAARIMDGKILRLCGGEGPVSQ